MSTSTAAEEEPNKKKMEGGTTSPIEALLGPSLVVNNKLDTKPTKQLMEGKELVALYFSASWCPPCQAFTPKLIEFYEKLQKSKKGNNKLEIVYVSSDKSLDEFEAYYGKMPWLAVPTDANSAQIKNQLAAAFKIRGIPTMIVLDVKTGNFITDDARNHVLTSSTNNNADAVYQQWKDTPAVPIDQATFSSGGGADSLLGKIIMYILKNPVYIFGLIYLYRKFMKQVQQPPDNSLEDAADEQQMPSAADEPEF